MKYKFRVWDKQNKKMYYPEEIRISFAPDDFITVEDLNGNILIQPEFVELSQCTGKKDISNKSIYKGDIINCTAQDCYKEDNGIHVVKFSDCLQFCLQDLERYNFGDDNKTGLPLTWGGWLKLEIIGNIYEHPYFLNEEKSK